MPAVSHRDPRCLLHRWDLARWTSPGALPLRGQQEPQQEPLVKEVSRKLFSSKQASDGREAHRGSVSGSEHSWAVQAPPAAPGCR